MNVQKWPNSTGFGVYRVNFADFIICECFGAFGQNKQFADVQITAKIFLLPLAFFSKYNKSHLSDPKLKSLFLVKLFRTADCFVSSGPDAHRPLQCEQDTGSDR